MIESRRLQIQKNHYPLFCQWELTCRCNLRCVMCYTDCFNTPEKVRTELSTSEILRIMDEIREGGCAELCLTGGEPLARPDFFEIYEHAIRSGFLVTVFSNGTLITEEIANRFAAMPPRAIEISLHGVTPETFERVTQGKGSFEKCMKAIGMLLNRGIPVLLKTVAMTLNQEEVFAIKNYVSQLPGVRFKMGIQMRPTLAGSFDPARYEIPDGDINKMFQVDSQLLGEVCESRCRESVCHGGKLKFHIDAYGQMQLCSGNRRESYDLRNGSFQEGFYHRLPEFFCPSRVIPALAKNRGEVRPDESRRLCGGKAACRPDRQGISATKMADPSANFGGHFDSNGSLPEIFNRGSKLDPPVKPGDDKAKAFGDDKVAHV